MLFHLYQSKFLMNVHGPLIKKSVAKVEHGVSLTMPKWDQHRGPTRKASKTRSQDRDGPPHLLPKMDKARQDPGRGVGGLRVQPLSRALLKTRGLLGSVVLQAEGLPPGASSVLKSIRTPTWALGARRLGLQEEGRSLGVGRWGCQRTTSTFT